MNDSSLKLRLWVSLVLFVSAYSPLMIILAIQDVNPSLPRFFGSPITSCVLIFVAICSSIITILAVKNVASGLHVVVTKAANKSGDMFGYTIPYMLSFMRVPLDDWRTLLSLALFLTILFIMAYRTQTVFINPVLAIAGYMLIDCTFNRDGKETQAMVLTREPISVGSSIKLDRLSHYLYIRAHLERKNSKGHA